MCSVAESREERGWFYMMMFLDGSLVCAGVAWPPRYFRVLLGVHYSVVMISVVVVVVRGVRFSVCIMYGCSGTEVWWWDLYN